MKRLLVRMGILLLLVSASINVILPKVTAHAQDPENYVPDQVVVKLYQAADLADIAADHELDPIPLDQFGARAIYLMRILDGASPLVRTEELAADPRIRYAEANFIGRAPEGQQRVSWAKGEENSTYQEQWSVRMIRLAEAHTITRGAGVTVAVLDGGVDTSHPALNGKLVEGYDFVDLDSDPSEVGSPDQNVSFGHGTHVAGVIALVAPEANIMPIRVLDTDGASNVWVLAEAMAYAVNPDGDVNTDDGADVINLSLSTTHPTNLFNEIRRDVTCANQGICLAGQNQQGVVVVAAAGNNGSVNFEYPASEAVTGLLAVGASTPADVLASFSNRGSWIHVLAPGESIMSSVPGGGYAFWSGTSMSAPFVAGEAALIRASDQTLDAATVVKRILESSEDIGDPIPWRIDVAAALNIPRVVISGEYICMGQLGPVTADNVLVPKDQTCNLVGTRVLGNIKVEEGAALTAVGMDVRGSVQAKGALLINISNSAVDGSLQMEEGHSASIETTLILGSAQFLKNSGNLTISNNRIKGNLYCKENSLMPAGTGNTVSGNKEEQCSGL